MEHIPHLRRPPPQAFRHSKQEGVAITADKSAPPRRQELSSESTALREEADREKMLDEYYNSVRQSTAQVKSRLSELEKSLGMSESDSILVGVQAPNFESLGISFNARDVLDSGPEQGQRNDDVESVVSEDASENADEDDPQHMTNADVIVKKLEQASKWLNEAKSRGLDTMGEELEDDEDGTGASAEEKDIKEPSELFGSEVNQRKFDALLARCEDVKATFSRNLGTLLKAEKTRMEGVVRGAEGRHFLLDQECESVREEILHVDRRLRSYNTAHMKVRALVEERLLPSIRALQDHVLRLDDAIARGKEDVASEQAYHALARQIQGQVEAQIQHHQHQRQRQHQHRQRQEDPLPMPM